MKSVLIVYRFLPQYRIDFYTGLRDELKERNIELTLVYGKSKNTSKGDEVTLDWAVHVPNLVINLGIVRLIWQPCLRYIKKKDLVIVEQANVLLLNYLLMVLRKLKRKKFAFWGHGINQQSKENSLRNRFKKLIINQTDWWFTYTEGVKRIVTDCGFDESKVTNVENAIDTKYLSIEYTRIKNAEVLKEKRNLNIMSENIGIYCGGLYKEKRIEFLISAAVKIKEEIKDFHLIIVGSGPDLPLLKSMINGHDWIHYLGTKFGIERVIYFKMSKVFLLPGAVGLAILDSFSMLTPMITSKYEYHGPEIEYLENEYNGLISENEINAYVKAVVNLLTDGKKLDKLISGCIKSKDLYTVENMVNNFANGISKSLTSAE